MKRTAADRAKNIWDRRYFLIMRLGGKCVECGAEENLEFHHVKERTWKASRTSRWRRMVLYEREADEGVIELLCADCNKISGKPSSWNKAYQQVSDEPLPD